MKSALYRSLGFVAILWCVKIIETGLGLDFASFGLYPHTLAGFFGIFSAPLIHSTWPHLISNTPPLLILGTLLGYGYPKTAKIAWVGLYVGSGLSVWLLARDYHHIGASGLTHGLMFFIFTMGLLRRDNLSMAFAMITFFLYGSMIWTIFPHDPSISYELHFFGALWGLILAFFLKSVEPKPIEKKYDWEGEEEESNDYSEP